MSLYNELKRRNVFKVAAAYIIVAWLLLQVSDTLVPALHLPEWFHSGVAFVLILGFPVAMVFAWAFELTPDGLKRESEVDSTQSTTQKTGRKLDFLIIGVLVVALGYFAYDKFDGTEQEDSTESDKTIAVLPFVNMSDDPGNEYFSDGVSEEILNLLASIPDLRVTSRSSAFSFKGQNLDVPTMAARLNVAHVLEGSVRKSGNQLRITAQLIDVESDSHVWSETFDRELENIFAIQDEIAAAVVDALKITLLGEEPRSTETDPEAYALYLQGRHFNNQGTAESSKQAETLLKQALEIDPGFAPTRTELGEVYMFQAVQFAIRPIDESNELARHAIQRALEIDPQFGRAYAVLAAIEIYYDWDFVIAFQHVQQALALNPGDAAIQSQVAELEEILGRLDEAIELHLQSIALDPLWPTGHFRLGRAFSRAHRLEEAVNSLQMVLFLSPGWVGAQYRLGRVLLAQGDAPAALLAMEQETGDFYRLTGIAIVQHALGDTEASDAALKKMIEVWGVTGAYQVAEVYAFRGEIDDAFDWLERAHDNRDAGMTNLLLDPLLANLHDDPRWEPLLDKMGLPH